MNGYFDRIVCINLERRPFRWDLARRRLMHHGIKVERFLANEGPTSLDDEHTEQYWGRKRARIGCAASHIALVAEALASRLEGVFIFEGDIVLHPEFTETFRSWIRELPADWDMLHLGGLHHAEPDPASMRRFQERDAPVRITDHVYRLRASYCLHAYAVRRALFDEVVRIDPLTSGPIDNEYMSRFQRHRRCYGLLLPEEARPGTWGPVRQDPEIPSDIRDEADHRRRIDWRWEPRR